MLRSIDVSEVTDSTTYQTPNNQIRPEQNGLLAILRQQRAQIDATRSSAPEATLMNGQLDAWETSGSSPPAPGEPQDEPEGGLA